MIFLMRKLASVWLGKLWYWLLKFLGLWFRGFILQLLPLVLVFFGFLFLVAVYRFC